ncbi:MAG: methyltransferase domain-containing protein [Thermaerobacter sp.]|nr:methyltransferase domain-containing protein [Thermaerobacter sp.]
MPSDVQDFFARHAAGYSASESHRSGNDLVLLTQLLRPTPSDRLVDIAAGTGFTALHLRPLIAQAVLVDFTPKMLKEAERLAKERGLEIETLVADAASVPLPDGAFTLATCRRAAHHFEDIPGFLGEARRLLAAGGRLGISDMTADEPAIDWFNRLERVRDSSHRAALSPRQWRAAVEAAGFAIEVLEVEPEDYALLRWLSPVSREEVDFAALEDILRSATAEERAALEIREESDGWHFVKSRTVLVARRTQRKF